MCTGLKRHTFGEPLHEHQGWRWSLAGAAIDLAAAQLMVESAAAQAKVFATRMAGRHITALMHAMSAEGLRQQHPLLRRLAAVQVAALIDGSTEMLLDRVARGQRHAG